VISLLLNAPFFEGSSATSTLVPGLYDVAVAGIPFQIDRKMNGTQYQYRSETIELLKPGSDQELTVGEHSLSSDGLWRRAMESWHAGAGQSYYDRPDSSTARFRSSKGINPWVKWQFSLLPDTQIKLESTNSNLFLAPAGTRLYVADDQTLKFTSDLDPGAPTFTTVTGTNASSIRSMTSDGFHVFAAYSNGIAMTTTAITVATSAWSALVADVIGYHKGFLVASGSSTDAHKLYAVDATGAATLLYTHLNSGFTWVGFADGPAGIYAAGYAGDKSLIYRIPFEDNGDGLDVPVPAGELPDGEVIRAIQGYLGFVVLGTDKGVRFCAVNSDGSLTVGSLIPADNPVRAFEGQDRFVWYGLTNYDSSSTGLGRLDFLTINDGPAPAYASDLMVDGQGAITSIATFGDKRVFSVAGLGVYAELDDLVAEGTIDSGFITFSLPDLKTAVAVDVRHEVLEPGTSHETALAIDNGSFETLGVHASTVTTSRHGETWPAGQASGELSEIRHVLRRGDPTVNGPVITRVTLKALPKTTAQQRFTVPVVIAETLNVRRQQIMENANSVVRAIRSMRDRQQVVTFQEFDESYQVVVDGFVFVRDSANETGVQPRGTLVLALKTLDVEG
jgi:hypothetical protein